MPVKTIKIIFLTALFTAFCGFPIAAQPRGDEPDRIRKMVNEQLARISETGGQIAKNPKDEKLYAKRAGLYVELLRMLNSGYLSGFYGEKPPELSVAAITGKATIDFSRALKISPRAEYYAGRGEMYALRWRDDFRSFNWYEAVRKLEDPEWRDFIGWRTPEKELKILAGVLQNPDFANAEKDFEKVFKLTADAHLLKKSRQQAANIYLERSARIFHNLELNKDLLARANSFVYSIFGEIERALTHLRKGGAVNRNDQSPDSFDEVPWAKNWTLFDALLYKAYIAEFYGENKTALQSLNEAEKYFDKNEPYSATACDFYPFRSRIHLKLGNLDAALADADFKYPNPKDLNKTCYNAYEPRGDVHFAKGDYLSAVEEYTEQINVGYSDVLYKKRGLAYLKLGEAEKAVADFTKVINHSTTTAEKYRLRAQAYRLAGNEKLALEDEKQAERIAENDKQISIKRGVYGKIVMPPGTVLDGRQVFVRLSFKPDPKQVWSSSVDAQGRFIFRNIEAPDFRLFAYFDGMKNGVAVRFYGSTDKKNVENKLVGPVIIKLDREAGPSDQPIN